MLPKAKIKGGMVETMKANRFWGFVVIGAGVAILGIGQIVGKIYEEPDTMTKAQAEARSSMMLREPTNCWGEKEGWQCKGIDTHTSWVSCLGKDCFRIK